MKPKNKQIIAGALTAALGLQLVFLGLLMPRSAAQAVLPVTDVPQIGAIVGIESTRRSTEAADEVKEHITTQLTRALITSVTISVKNILLEMVRTGLDQSMSYLMTGKAGQEPMFYTQPEKYWGRVARDRLGMDMISALANAQPLSQYFDICDPQIGVKVHILKSAEINMNLGKNKTGESGRTPPDCTWKQISENYQNRLNEIQNMSFDNLEVSSFLVIEDARSSFRPQQNDIGAYLLTFDEIASKVDEAKKAEEAERNKPTGADLKPNTNATETETKTSKIDTQLALTKPKEKAFDIGEKEVDLVVSNMEQLGYGALNMLINSVVSKKFAEFIFNWVKGKLSPRQYDVASRSFNYQASAERISSTLNKISFSYDQRSIDLVSEFSTCPSKEIKGPNHCVIDKKFANAINFDKSQPLTVAQAVGKGYLSLDTPFIGPGELNDSSECYVAEDKKSARFCYSNLVKLRKARILPIGWELAAKQLGPSEKDKTLGDMINVYYDMCPDSDGNCPDGQDCRFCHLIDKNWILKYPDTRCDALGSGELLLASRTDERSDYCADLTSCISRNDDGECLAYSYCAAEKNIWRFGGDACEPQFDSCTELKMRDNRSVHYLLNTVDPGTCSEENFGCKWYSQWQTDRYDAVSEWAEDYPADYDPAWGSAKIFLDADIESKECRANEEGCTRLINTDLYYGANLLPNNKFELFTGEVQDDKADVFYGWNNDEPSADSNGLSYDGYGPRVMTAAADGVFQLTHLVEIAPKNFPRYFEFSAFVNAPQDDLRFVPRSATLGDVENFQNPISPINYLTAGLGDVLYDVVDDNPNNDGDVYKNAQVIFRDDGYVTANWTELTIVVRVPPQTAYLGLAFVNAENVMIDNALIAEMRDPYMTNKYIDYNTTGATYLRKAPDYYYCYDSKDSRDQDPYSETNWYTPVSRDDLLTGNDKLEYCTKFTKICSAEEVGCREFIDENNSSLFAVASREDSCPANCAGYETFSRSSTIFADSQFPEYLIPATAATCNAAQTGCEEFTNLDAIAQGGEGLEYYIELRHCIKPDADQCGVFYTWAGSEQNGYQLQTHTLQKAADALGTLLNQPAVANENLNSACNAQTYDPSNTAMAGCTQFYNDAGQVFYAFNNLTIECSDDCHPYRRTLKYGDAKDCTNRGGEWTADGCVFWSIPSRSRSCSVDNAGCREYKGNAANDVNIVLDDTFDFQADRYYSDDDLKNLCENTSFMGDVAGVWNDSRCYYAGLNSIIPAADLSDENKCAILGTGDASWNGSICIVNANWTADFSIADFCKLTNLAYDSDKNTCYEPGGLVDWSGGELSAEAMVAGGHSLKINYGSSAVADLSALPIAGERFVVSFWAKQTAAASQAVDLNIALMADGLTQAMAADNLELNMTNDFRHYSTDILAPSGYFRALMISVLTEGVSIYIDSVQVKALNDTQYLILNSWNTPPVCDQTLDLQPLPQAQLGCQYFRNRDNQPSYLKSFRSICNSGVSGCNAFIDTKNSTNPFGPSFNEDRAVDLCFDLGLAADDLKGCYLIMETALFGAVNTAKDEYRANCGEVEDCEFSYLKDDYCLFKGYELDVNGDCVQSQRGRVKIPPHNLIYLVQDDDFTCRENAEACTMLGLPELDEQKEVLREKVCVQDPSRTCVKDEIGCTCTGSGKSIWNTILVRLDPDEMVDAPKANLCSQTDVGCEKYVSSATKQAHYFKNPDRRVCEWRKGQQAGAVEPEYNWYVKDSNELCRYDLFDDYGLPLTREYYNDGARQLIHFDDPAYRGIDPATGRATDGWVGECPAKEDMCTAFVDPTDVSNFSAAGKAYYYIDDRSVDRESCNGQASRSEGCVLLDNTRKPELTYSTRSTYLTSEAQDNKFVSPEKGIDYSALKTTAGASCANIPKCDDLYSKLVNGLVLEESSRKCTLAGEDANDAAACGSILFDSVCGPVNNYTWGIYNPTIPSGCSVLDDPVKCDPTTLKQQDPGADVLDVANCYFNLLKKYDCLDQGGAWSVSQNKCFLPQAQEFSCDSTESAECTLEYYLNDVNNANEVIKVVRDRECAQWYDCKAGSYEYNPQTNSEVFTCQSLGLCMAMEMTEGDRRCTKYVSGGEEDWLLTRNEKITFEAYSQRPIGWTALDYSGYTIANQYPLQFYDAIDLAKFQPAPMTSAKSDFRLVNVYSTNDACAQTGHILISSSSSGGITKVTCAADLYGESPEFAPAPECRLYPQKEAPFASIVKSDDRAKDQFSMANTCTSKSPAKDCGCNYKVRKYGGGQEIKYFPADEPAQSGNEGYCEADPSIECACAPYPPKAPTKEQIRSGKLSEEQLAAQEIAAEYIKTDKRCSTQSEACLQASNVSPNSTYATCLIDKSGKTDLYQGWEGYCLEKDLSTNKNGTNQEHPCLTWYPMQSMAGLRNLNNQYDRAGFYPPEYGFSEGGPYFCLDSARYEYRQEFMTRKVLGPITVDNDALDPQKVESACFTEAKSVEQIYDCVINQKAVDLTTQGTSGEAFLELNGNLIFYMSLLGMVNGEIVNLPIEQFKMCPNKYVQGEVNLSYSKLLRYWVEADPKPEYYIIITFKCSPDNGEGFYYLGETEEPDNDGKFYEIDLGDIFASKENVEEEALFCTEFTAVTDGDGQEFINKAYTNKIYQSYDFGAPVCDHENISKYQAEPPSGAAIQKIEPWLLAKYPNGFDDNPNMITNLGTTVEDIKCAITVEKLFNDLPHNYNSFWSWYYGYYDELGYAQRPKCQRDLGVGFDITDLENYINYLRPEYNYWYYSQLPNGTNGIFTPNLLCGYHSAKTGNESGFYGALDLAAPLSAIKEEEGNGNKLNELLLHSKLTLGLTNEWQCGLTDGAQSNISSGHYGGVACFSDKTKIFTDKFTGSVGSGGLFASQYGHWRNTTAIAPEPLIPTSHPDTKWTAAVGLSSDYSFTYVNHPPIIAAPITRTLSNGKEIKAALINNFAIGTNSGDVLSGDVEAHHGQVLVDVKFYAWAHDDQMPLTRVKVDWGDGHMYNSSVGKYKNKKPYCQPAAGELVGRCYIDGKEYPGLTCSETADSCLQSAAYSAGVSCVLSNMFGDTPQACEQGTFRYENTYSCYGPISMGCSKTEVENGSYTSCECTDEKISNCWNKEKSACQFVPAVQVLDNWDWCNASSRPNGVSTTSWVGQGQWNGGNENNCEKPQYKLLFPGRILLYPY